MHPQTERSQNLFVKTPHYESWWWCAQKYTSIGCSLRKTYFRYKFGPIKNCYLWLSSAFIWRVLCMRLCCLIAPLWFCPIFQQDSTSTPWGTLLGKLSPVWTILSLNWCSTFSNSLDIGHTGYVWVSLFFFFFAGLVIKLIYTSLICIFPFVPSARLCEWSALKFHPARFCVRPNCAWNGIEAVQSLTLRWRRRGGSSAQPSINSEDLSKKRQNIACICPVL